MSSRAEARVNWLAARMTAAAVQAQARVLAMQSENTVAELRGEPIPHAAGAFYGVGNDLAKTVESLGSQVEDAWIDG